MIAPLEYAMFDKKDIKRRIYKLKYSAKKRGLKVRLMEYEYENLLNLGCHYCGKELVSESGYCLDRINSKKGYTLHNVVPCCKTCNMAKGTMDFNTFVDWIERAYFHQKAIFDKIKSMPNEDYSYKEEKDAHKEFMRSDNRNFIGNI